MWVYRDTATIAEVIPSVLRAFSEWEIIKEKTSTIGNQLCDLLIIQFRNRFNYELNSHLYQVEDFILTFKRRKKIIQKNSIFNKLMFVRLKLKMKFRFFANLY